MALGESGMAGASRGGGARAWSRLPGRPGFWLVAFLLCVAVGLALPLRLPLGANYWDTAVYLDAIQRIRLGQAPSRDFFAPVGPLGYYLATGLDALFPRAQPMLLVNWAILPVALPLLAVLVADVERRSRQLALALALPFLLFAALPINLHELYPMPGLDGFGHYNRHVALLLYLLVAALFFVESRGRLISLVTALMLALFLVKITGAVAGAILVVYAVLTGRLKPREAILAAGVALAALAALDLTTGIVRAYLADILTLLRLNTGALAPRFLTVASVKFNVIAPALALFGVLGLAAWRARPRVGGYGLAAAAASPLGWLAVTLFALAFFETQNTGSLEFIGLWPLLLIVLRDWRASPDRLRPLVLVLVMAVTLPSLLIFVSRGARAMLGAPSYAGLDLPDLGPLGRVSVKREIAAGAPAMLEHYATQQAAYADLVARGLLPSAILYSQIDYQANWLLEVQQGVAAIRSWEAANQRRLDGFFTLDFVDPFNRLLGRRPPRHAPIGVDPGRNKPVLAEGMVEELRRSDAILAPTCPPTTARAALARHFAPLLQGRQRVALAPCWEMYLRP